MQTAPIEVLQWYYLIFELPFLTGVLYLALLASGLTGEHEIHAEVDFDNDVDLDVDSDADVGGDFDHGVEHSTEMDHGTDHGPNALVKALSFLGVGRVPISLIVMSFCFIWGTSGFLAIQFFKSWLFYPELFALPSIGTATMASVFGTRWLARGLGRIMPSTETYATNPEDLVGRTAEVLDPVSSLYGRVRLLDQYGNLQDVVVRVPEGADSIPANGKVVLLRYDANERVYTVRRDILASQRLVGNN